MNAKLSPEQKKDGTRIVDITPKSATRATAMVRFDDGFMGAVTIYRSAAEVFMAKAHRGNFAPDEKAAKFVTIQLKNNFKLTLSELRDKLMGEKNAN